MKKKTTAKSNEFDAKKKQRLLKIISDLQKKMKELDKMRNDIEYRHISFSMKPKQTFAMIEEIKVPSLEMLRDEGTKKK